MNGRALTVHSFGKLGTGTDTCRRVLPIWTRIGCYSPLEVRGSRLLSRYSLKDSFTPLSLEG